MNERIQELAVKAKLMAEEDINRQISYNTELKAFAEKFAELMVRECAYINFYKRTDISLKDAYRVSQVILEHFGVEQ